jgi:hypothetical protein
MERLRERKAALDRAIAKSRAGLADTQQILKRIDAAVARFNALFLKGGSLALFGLSSDELHCAFGFC